MAARASAAQSRPEVLRGRVTSDSGRTAVGNADITVTRAPDRAFKQTKSAADGSWRIDWSDGTGDYLVHVAAAGYETFRKRVGRTDSTTTFVVDVSLVRLGARQLAAVMVQAQRARPTRAATQGVETGAAETSNTAGPGSAIGDRLPADLAGDLTAAALLAPGIAPVAGGFSVLGLSPSQNSVTLNGMTFSGSSLPRDLPADIRVSRSIYDPSSGWFSGARTNIQVAPGGLFSSRRARLVADIPALQSTDPVSSRLGQRYLGAIFSSGGSGQLVQDKFAYTYGLQAARRNAEVTSLATRDQEVLERSGVALDSASRLLAPTASPVGGSTSFVDQSVVAIARIDYAPYDWTTLSASKTTWGLTAYANVGRTSPQNASPLATPSHGAMATSRNASLQASYSTYFGRDYLVDVRTGISHSGSRSDPLVQIPEGRVLVTSHFADSPDAVSTLQFGGNGGARSRLSSWTWETSSDFQFYPAGLSRHRFKISADSRLDTYSHDIGNNLLGAYSYQSLADLEANRPASFSRTITSPVRTGGAWNGFAAVGDLWRIVPSFQVLYGARMDGNAFLQTPARNEMLETALGVRTDRAPSSFRVSPRLGFDLNVPHLLGGRGTVIRGGVGKFRNLLSPTLLSTASVATGLPNGTQRISCVGSSVPLPDWSSFERDQQSIPSTCVGGTSVFSDLVPDVQAFAESYRPPESWRGNLAWSSRIGRFPFTIEGVYSRNLSQAGFVDANFAGVELFKTYNEQRPVYVPASSIVASSGVVSPVAARRNAAFGRVMTNLSDETSVSRQATISTVVPLLRFPTRTLIGGWRIAYTYSDTRARQRGFDATTFGDPRDIDWSRASDDIKHQIVSQMTIIPSDYVRGVGIVLSGRAQSGIPFTPIIRTDVNGDGLANDRPVVLRDAPLSACLRRQVGLVVGRNSCEGPWTASMNAALIVGRDGVSFLPSGVELVLNVSNPLGGIDRLVHGTNGLRGWGATAHPDPILYTVRGFDAAATQFVYEVNPRFGRTTPIGASIRAPFRLSLDVSIDLAPPRTQQQLDRWLTPGRAGHAGPKVTKQDLARRLQRNVPDPYAELLQQADALLLSADQVKSVQAAQVVYRGRIDALWDSLAGDLAALSDSYDAGDVFRRTDTRIGDAWELTRLDVREHLASLLSPVQLTVLPTWTARFFNAERPFYQRVFVP